MDQTLMNIIIGIAETLSVFILKALWDAQKDLQRSDKDLSEKVGKVEVLVAGNYITRHEFNKSIDAVFSKLDAISDKLDNKVDKGGHS